MERVSEFMDGELNVDSAEREIARLKSDAAAREAWHTYHLIGEAMRGANLASPALTGFNARFSERLAAEPTVLAPHTRKETRPRKLQTYVLSAAASVAAVAVVGWMGLAVMKADAPPVQVAQKPAAPVAPLSAPVAVAPLVAGPAQHMHEYLLAHSGISPSTQIQGVTTYIRTVAVSEE